MKPEAWTRCDQKLPDEGVVVWTKISDSNGERNIQAMRRQGNLWYCKDGMYVYYTPTHWKD